MRPSYELLPSPVVGVVEGLGITILPTQASPPKMVDSRITAAIVAFIIVNLNLFEVFNVQQSLYTDYLQEQDEPFFDGTHYDLRGHRMHSTHFATHITLFVVT